MGYHFLRHFVLLSVVTYLEVMENNLPPGISDHDIDAQFGDEIDISLIPEKEIDPNLGEDEEEIEESPL